SRALLRRGERGHQDYGSHVLDRIWGRRGRLACFEAAEEEVERLVGGFTPAHAGTQIETKETQVLRDPVPVLSDRRMARFGAIRDHEGTDGGHFHRELEAEHRQGALDLPEIRLQRGQRVTLRVVARERVQYLLDVLKVGEDFLGNLSA